MEVSDFFNLNNQKIFQAIQELFETSKSI
ncbi:MAG: hypothetical protein Q8755_03310, partial [Candidatus Phytoplasma australasiaticum]|nr:hypothetical protein [Candidatus Phytoplasma australasiaticum]